MIAGSPKEDLETVIDRLHDFVKINKRTSLESAAGALGLPQAQAERLALLLEESGLVRVQYSLGKTELLAKEEQPAEGAAQPGKRKATMREIAKTLEHEVMESESVLEFIERDLHRRIGLAEGTIIKMENSGTFSREDVDFLKKEVGILGAQLSHFKSEVAELSGIEKEFEGKVNEFGERILALEATALPRESMRAPASPLYFAIKPLADAFSSLKNSILFILSGKAKPSGPVRPAEKLEEPEARALPSAAVQLEEKPEAELPGGEAGREVEKAFAPQVESKAARPEKRKARKAVGPEGRRAKKPVRAGKRKKR